MVEITEAPFCFAFLENHLPTSKDVPSLQDLRGCTRIVFDRKVHPMLHEMISRRAAEEGVPYKDKRNVMAAAEAFQSVAESVGIAFLTKATAFGLQDSA
jgi:hypothetical protein